MNVRRPRFRQRPSKALPLSSPDPRRNRPARLDYNQSLRCLIFRAAKTERLTSRSFFDFGHTEPWCGRIGEDEAHKNPTSLPALFRLRCKYRKAGFTKFSGSRCLQEFLLLAQRTTGLVRRGQRLGEGRTAATQPDAPPAPDRSHRTHYTEPSSSSRRHEQNPFAWRFADLVWPLKGRRCD